MLWLTALAAGGCEQRLGGGNANTEDCVEVTGAGIQPWYDLHVLGTGFDEFETKRVRVLAGVRPIEQGRFAIGEATIEGGAFDLVLPEALNEGNFKGIAIHIDEDGDDRCSADEWLGDYTTGIVDRDIELAVNPDEVCNNGSCAAWEAQAQLGSCMLNSIDVDLTGPLSCSNR